MKRSIFVVGFAVIVLTAAAQVGKENPPQPPAPPPPPSGKMKDVLPPPPPPPPAEPPAPKEPPTPPVPPAPPEPPLPPEESEGEVWLSDEYEAFLKKNPSVESLGWNAKNEVIVRLKSGKEERYKLDDENNVKAAEAKYGKLPAAPPPPPPPPPTPGRKSEPSYS